MADSDQCGRVRLNEIGKVSEMDPHLRPSGYHWINLQRLFLKSCPPAAPASPARDEAAHTPGRLLGGHLRTQGQPANQGRGH